MTTIKFKWVRNSDIAYPSVWRTFTAKASQNSELREYVVRDTTPEEYEAAVDLMNDFLIREPASAALGEQLEKKIIIVVVVVLIYVVCNVF